MPKVLWVALPLLLALALLAVLAWRGRAPSRRAVNIVSSLLLLGYVGATAGLGLFWVANQQLPVFDWHYLFGYGTLALLVVHLVFNLPVVWRFLARRRAGASATPRTGRRHLVAALGGGAVASAGAFWLGWRLGREQAAEAAARTPPGTADPALALVERFHAATSHGRGARLRPAPGVDWGDAPPSFRQWPQAPRTPLPPPGSASPGGADLATLGDLLWHTAGVTEARGGLLLRAAPSSGALFSTELYLLVDHWPSLAPGVWHHQARDHVLERLAAGAERTGAPAPSAMLVATAVFGRTGRKYGERTYRYLLADLGHALENLRMVADELRLPLRWQPAFDDLALGRRLQLDAAEEGVLAVALLGRAPAAGPDAGIEPAAPAVGSEPARPASGAVPRPPGLTGEIHTAMAHRRRCRCQRHRPLHRTFCRARCWPCRAGAG